MNWDHSSVAMKSSQSDLQSSTTGVSSRVCRQATGKEEFDAAAGRSLLRPAQGTAVRRLPRQRPTKVQNDYSDAFRWRNQISACTAAARLHRRRLRTTTTVTAATATPGTRRLPARSLAVIRRRRVAHVPRHRQRRLGRRLALRRTYL